MKEVKVHPAVTVIGSIVLICVVLGGLVWVRASKDFDDATAFGGTKAGDRSDKSAQRDGAGGVVHHDGGTDGEQPQRPAKRSEGPVRTLCAAALEQTRQTTSYDAAYVKLSYPGGDVPQDRGVCSDVIVRAFRKIGVDLQKEVHEDMSRHFAAYAKSGNKSKPDANIDHRRVVNLMTFFKRQGAALPVTRNPEDYRPGDVVAWDLGRGVTHIGLLVDEVGADGRRPMVVHNIGQGVKQEDVLLSWKIIGHYRYGVK